MIPLTVPEIARLLTAFTHPRTPPGHAAHWPGWKRRHQALARWYHQRTHDSQKPGDRPRSANEWLLPY